MKALSVKKTNDLTTAFFFLLPSLVIFGVFVYYALGYNLYLSTTSWNFLTPNKNFVGLRNYVKLFSSKIFWQVFGNTIYYALGTVSLILVM